jgi:heme-degrading monooxygenase HmoA
MSSITTITLFRFKGALPKIWAFGQMQFAHKDMSKIQGLTFYKLMGSGSEVGFSSKPDWGVYALLCVWENEQYSADFFGHAEIFKRYQAHTTEQWTIFMKPIKAKGLWSGGTQFIPSTNLDEANPLIAVITRATIRTSKLIQFWAYVPISQRPIKRGCKGLIYTKGVGEAPFLQMATFSIWENTEALHDFAYNSQEHREAIRKAQKYDWFKEELFVRFQPYRSMGTWGGQDLLAAYLTQ